MLNCEKREILQEAYDVLVKHNLYRRGALSYETADIQPRELGEAIDVAAGVILEHLKLIAECKTQVDAKKMYAKEMATFHAQWKNAEKSVKLLSKIAEERKAEIKRLRALLASNGLKYKKGDIKCTK